MTAVGLHSNSWGVFFHHADSSVYNVTYTASGRLVRLSDGTVLWQAQCRSGLDRVDSEPALLHDL